VFLNVMDIFDDTFQYFCVSPFRHGARPVSTKYNVCTKYIFGLPTRQTFCSFWCLSLPTRGTPRLYEIQRLYKIHFWGCLHVKLFRSFLRLSLPTRGTPRLYEIQRLYKNTFFWGGTLQSPLFSILFRNLAVFLNITKIYVQ
jgi:hypothetical protein